MNISCRNSGPELVYGECNESVVVVVSTLPHMTGSSRMRSITTSRIRLCTKDSYMSMTTVYGSHAEFRATSTRNFEEVLCGFSSHFYAVFREEE